MIFPERIQSIREGDRVLEIGPGGSPYFRSDVLLEKRFANENEAEAQRGYAKPLVTEKEVVYFDGGRFPFENHAFDYVICSHVLEHMPTSEIEHFVGELVRVASRGYVEFPTVYYEFLYNFPEHIQLLRYVGDGRTIRYLPKAESSLEPAAPVQQFFYETAVKGYFSLVDDLKPYMFQGFEWAKELCLERAKGLDEVTIELGGLDLPPAQRSTHQASQRGVISRIRGCLRRIVGGKAS